MTAEIAILNKTAVVLAADSAVTISAGSDQQKIFDTADKLFELCRNDAIGVMINNDMNFMEAPLPVLIKKYREGAPRFSHVEHAARDFLQYLNDFGRRSPERIIAAALLEDVSPILKLINERARSAWNARVFDEDDNIRDEYVDNVKSIRDAVQETLSEQINVVCRWLESFPDAEFVGAGPLSLSEEEISQIRHEVEEQLPSANAEQKAATLEAAKIAVRKQRSSSSATGIIVAGFGSEELFPTLVSFEVFGMVGGRLKFAQTNVVDIDRDGDRARVIPFAQKEMVERFLYGLDAGIQGEVTRFCREAVPTIRARVMRVLEMPEDDARKLDAEIEVAEGAFLTGLASESFEVIRQNSREEIEDMVEFMPKPEMARMAEALVNLTSIKRRVSKGFETVGGPIDVAVISQAEGFVWVKRKHYFPAELNMQYARRMQRTTDNGGGDDA